MRPLTLDSSRRLRCMQCPRADLFKYKVDDLAYTHWFRMYMSEHSRISSNHSLSHHLDCRADQLSFEPLRFEVVKVTLVKRVLRRLLLLLVSGRSWRRRRVEVVVGYYRVDADAAAGHPRSAELAEIWKNLAPTAVFKLRPGRYRVRDGL